MDIVRISTNMLAMTEGTPNGLFPTARSCVENVPIALGRIGAHGHHVLRHVVQEAPRHVGEPKMDHFVVELNAQDPQIPPDHATTQIPAQWIALGRIGATGQNVQRHVVQAHRDVGERKMQHSMVERNAQDPRTKTDHATHSTAQ